MDNLKFYRNRVLAKGSSIQEIKMHEKKKSFQNYFENTLNRHTVEIKGEERIVVIQDMRFADELKDDKYMILPADEDIEAGDYAIWDNRTWLVTSKEYQTIKDHQTTRIGKCNLELKWIDENGNLIKRWSIMTGKTLYTTGIKDEKVIEIPNGMIGVILPLDEEAKKLKREQCFILNKTKYRLTFYNEVELDGLIVLICTEIEPSHLDDKVNEIADRWVETDKGKIDRLPWLDSQKPPVEPNVKDPEDTEEPDEGVTYTITGQSEYPNVPDSEIFGNEWCKYTVHKIANGEEVAGKFTFEIDNENIATITNVTDNTVTITAKRIIKSEDIILTAIDIETNEIVVSKIIKILGR